MGRRQISAEELEFLFVLIGRGIWHLQYVEDALHNTVTLKGEVKIRGSITQDQAEALLAKVRRKTLGQSLKISRESQLLNELLQTRLEKFLEERNWLVHRSVNQNGDDLYVDEARVALFSRIELFSEEAKALQKLIVSELEAFVVSQGVSQERVLEEAIEKIRKRRGEKV